MDTVGYWLLGLLVVSLTLRAASLLAGPVLEYDGDNAFIQHLSGWLDDTLALWGSVVFLALPLAAVYGIYMIGRWVWTLVAR